MKLRLPSSIAILLVVAAFVGACGKPSSAPVPPASPALAAPTTPLVQKVSIADWCPEHGVPESVCTRCSPELVASFQENGDWCKEHGLPESQCIACHPDLKAKFEAMAPKSGG